MEKKLEEKQAVFCTYHPGIHAAHTCAKCGANFCSSCIIKKEADFYGLIKLYFICPKCNIYSQKIATPYSLEPFWNRFPQIFGYALHRRPLIFILLISLFQALLAYESIVFLIFHFFCFGMVLTYANIVLDESSNGNKKPPKVDLTEIQNNFSLIFKQAAILGTIGLLNVLFPIPLPFFGSVAMVFLPAIIIVLAITKSFFAAIMPHVFIRLAWRMGWPYLSMWFLLSVLFFAPVEIFQLTRNLLPGKAFMFLAIASMYYYMIVAYHLMGYLMYQYHERIGYDVAYDGEDENEQKVYSNKVSAKAVEQSNNELLSRINILIKDGNHDSAITLIQKETDGRPSELAVAERYFNLLRIRQRNEELAFFGRQYIPLLIKANHKTKACEVYLECLAINENFLEGEVENVFTAAKTLNELKYHTLAFNAFQKFIKQSPDHTLAPNAHLFIAMLLNEHFHDREKASESLQYLLKKYPFHENTSHVMTYLKKMQA